MTDETKTALLSKLRAPVADERDIWLVCLSREYYNGGDRPLLAVSTEATAKQIAAELQQYCRDLRERMDANNWQHEADPEISNKLYEESEALFAAAQFPHGVKLARYDLDDDFSFCPLTLIGAPAALASAPVAGEAKEEDEDAADAWRRLALQFDGHRMQALGHLRAMLADPQAHAERATEFLAAPPLSGEQVLAERIRDIAAPQASEAVRDASDMDDLRSRVMAAIHDCAALKPEDDESWDEWYCAAFDLLGTRVGDIFRAALSAQPGAQRTGGSDA